MANGLARRWARARGSVRGVRHANLFPSKFGGMGDFPGKYHNRKDGQARPLAGAPHTGTKRPSGAETSGARSDPGGAGHQPALAALPRDPGPWCPYEMTKARPEKRALRAFFPLETPERHHACLAAAMSSVAPARRGVGARKRAQAACARGRRGALFLANCPARLSAFVGARGRRYASSGCLPAAASSRPPRPKVQGPVLQRPKPSPTAVSRAVSRAVSQAVSRAQCALPLRYLGAGWRAIAKTGVGSAPRSRRQGASKLSI
ncbi:hypothetical protein PHYPSEUDO_014351 [Phytophthora pseudosyringae]|uniref:Uncharacterized protein n=1 Tax=Phytophthora pseudosyringae TaxID=221518 RepID=A0A8T1WKC8_9STRA|nr:hypothetical protein PHYPSEUDO_014351 [Phytophthora pseudosyringae]